MRTAVPTIIVLSFVIAGAVTPFAPGKIDVRRGGSPGAAACGQLDFLQR